MVARQYSDPTMPPLPSPTGPIQTRFPAVRAAVTSCWRATLAALSDAGHSQCQVCDAWSPDVFCADCLDAWARPRWRCAHCAIGLADVHARHLQAARLAGRTPRPVCADCRREPPPFDAAWAALDYGPPWNRLISAFKFHAAPELAGPLADLMLRAHRADPIDPGHAADPPELLLPVPLTAERWRERGYNQAWELARRLGPVLGVPVRDDLIERLVGGAHQAGLNGEARHQQVRGAYAVPAQARPALAGRHVMLVDDVMTTGATLAECARVLRRAGVGRVTVWALARTPAD